MKISISTQNTKMGRIPSISLPPGKACADGTPCFEKCYAMKAYRQYPNTREAYNRNYLMLTQHRDEYFKQLSLWILKNKPEYFRFHVSGDFVDAEHLRLTLELCDWYHETLFLAFTKCHHMLPTITGLVPGNLQLIASRWPEWGSVPPKGYRHAWAQDGTETRIPGTAVECLGRCDECLECFQPSDSDVWFALH